MKILVTGGNGYIGNQLIDALKNKYNVISFDISHEVESENNFNGDLRNKKNIRDCFYKHKNIDLVIHLAALAGVEKSDFERNLYIQNNFIGTFNLLETMVENKCEELLFASSCSVYGNNKHASETDPLEPESFYGLTKVICEELIKFYSKRHNIKYKIFRIFNVIGGYKDNKFFNSRIIPTLLKNIKKNKEINLFVKSNGKEFCNRDYVDILFLIETIEKFLKINGNEIINIGTGIKTNGEEIAKNCFSVTKKVSKINKTIKRVGDPDDSVSNNQKINKYIGLQKRSILEIIKQINDLI